MEEMNNEVLTGEVEELNTTTDNNVEVEDSGIGGVGLAIAGLAIIGFPHGTCPLSVAV